MNERQTGASMPRVWLRYRSGCGGGSGVGKPGLRYIDLWKLLFIGLSEVSFKTAPRVRHALGHGRGVNSTQGK